MRETCPAPARWFAYGALIAVGAYAACAGITWLRFGSRSRRGDGRGDAELERLIPVYDVVERIHVHVAAPAETSFSTACDLGLLQSGLIRAIFKARQVFLRGASEERRPSLRLVDQAKAWGWKTLEEQPGREIVFGAATQPWIANPVFRGLSPEEFRSFQEPGFVKIAWTLRADPIGDGRSIVTTETRAVGTDEAARARFRSYWAFVSPGTVLIRLIALGAVKRAAERAFARGPLAFVAADPSGS